MTRENEACGKGASPAAIPTEQTEHPVLVLRKPTPELYAEFANIDGPWCRGQMDCDEVWTALLDAQAEGSATTAAQPERGGYEPSSANAPNELIERLEAELFSAVRERGGKSIVSYVNPDGPEAANRIRELTAALEPFALAAENMDGDEPDDLTIWESPEAMSLLFGDLRRARTALKGSSQ